MMCFKSDQNCTINEEFDFFKGRGLEDPVEISILRWILTLNGHKMILCKNQPGFKMFRCSKQRGC